MAEVNLNNSENPATISNYFKNNIPQNNTSKNERVIALYTSLQVLVEPVN